MLLEERSSERVCARRFRDGQLQAMHPRQELLGEHHVQRNGLGALLDTAAGERVGVQARNKRYIDKIGSDVWTR